MSSLTWKTQPELFNFDSRRHRCKAKPPAYDGPLAAKEITTDKRADSVNEKWPENLACCHKRLYLNACAAHNSFPLTFILLLNMPMKRKLSFSYLNDLLKLLGMLIWSSFIFPVVVELFRLMWYANYLTCDVKRFTHF